jgi:formamidopyrimidine-DNA glycosylase
LRYKAIVSVLHRALECCLHPAPDFRDPEWWFQGFEDILRVYDREGKPCRRCGKSIQRNLTGRPVNMLLRALQKIGAAGDKA